jgi:hypothetical protein
VLTWVPVLISDGAHKAPIQGDFIAARNPVMLFLVCVNLRVRNTRGEAM